MLLLSCQPILTFSYFFVFHLTTTEFKYTATYLSHWWFNNSFTVKMVNTHSGICSFLFLQQEKESSFLLWIVIINCFAEWLTDKSKLTLLASTPQNCHNTFKQLVGNLPTNWLNEFDHFLGLVLKGLGFISSRDFY